MPAFNHVSYLKDTLNVALLTRNIGILGYDYATMYIFRYYVPTQKFKKGPTLGIL